MSSMVAYLIPFSHYFEADQLRAHLRLIESKDIELAGWPQKISDIIFFGILIEMIIWVFD